MNIFVISKYPIECAKCLDDLRLNKMILETAQILSTAIRSTNKLTSINPNNLYKNTHINHPCVKWACQNDNIVWLFELFRMLAKEKKERSGIIHKSWDKLGVELADLHFIDLPELKENDFINCTPYKDLPVFEAYKKTLCEKWDNDKRPPKWTKREKPYWYNPACN